MPNIIIEYDKLGLLGNKWTYILAFWTPRLHKYVLPTIE